MSNHVDRFFAAVSAMTGSSQIKHRLIEAYENNLQFIEESDLPPTARKPFAELKRRMKCVAPLNGEGSIRASVRKMSAGEAELCAQLMVDLLAETIRHNDSGQKRLPLQADDRRAVPPFLVKSG